MSWVERSETQHWHELSRFCSSNQSPYSPDFNPIELWWSQLKSFLRTFSPTTTEMVDKVISVALDLMNPQ
ncbi:transposase, partial [Dolichospermum circinale CS-534/05]